MIKPPYTKWINDIKTKLGFTRTMTASGSDVVDAVNKQSQQIVNLQNGLALPVITGTINNSGYIIKNGDFFIIDSFICIATADILNGATLTIGTNFKKLDMGALNKVLSTINERIRIANLPIDGNFNDYTLNGVTLYVCSWSDTRQNGPTGFNAGIVLVVAYGSFIWQFASPHTSNSVLWFRSKYGTTWHEWKQISNLGESIAYVEDGDTATKKTYTEDEFILWKGSLYTVNSGGIPLDTAISGHVTAVTGGGLNKHTLRTKTVTVTTSDGGSFFIPDIYITTAALLNVYVINKDNYINLHVTPSYNRFYCWATETYTTNPVKNTELQIQVIYFKL